MRDLPNNDNWEEWTLDKLKNMGGELEEEANMLDYTSNVFSEILGIDSISFGDEFEIDTNSKVIYFPSKKII